MRGMIDRAKDEHKNILNLFLVEKKVKINLKNNNFDTGAGA